MQWKNEWELVLKKVQQYCSWRGNNTRLKNYKKSKKMVEILALLKEIITKPSGEQPVAFSIRKPLQALQKPCIKIVTCSSNTYLFLSYTYTLLFCCKIKCCCDVFCSKLGHWPLFHCVYCKTILEWVLVSIWITNATHCV